MPNLANFAKGKALQGYGSGETSIQLQSGQGARFPAPPFVAVWWNSTDFPDAADDEFAEIVTVTDVSGDTLTVLRGQEDTVASAKNIAGKAYSISAVITAGVMAGYMPATPSEGTFRIKDGKYFQVWDSGDTDGNNTGWRTVFFAGGQWQAGPLDNDASVTNTAASYDIEEGKFKLYNQDQSKFQIVFLKGAPGEETVVIAP